MFYRPLQFGTLTLTSAAISTILVKLKFVMPLELAVNIILIVGAFTVFGWAYWCWMQNFALHTKLFLVAIILGCLLGVWL